jgi:hypothetical protein
MTGEKSAGVEEGYMIRMVTFEREYGSGAADIAGRLAERLGWKLWDQALTDEAARLMDCSSRTVGSARSAGTR